jgi:alpha-glucoside transport system substrate-binding protein
MTSPVLRLAAALAAPLLTLAAVTGCSGPAVRALSVIGPWTEAEENAFERVLKDFEDETGIRVDYQGTSAVNEVLRSKVQGGSPPDVAISWSPSELSRHARSGWLRPLNGILRGRGGEPYRRHWLLPGKGGDEIYAVPVKANVKSMIWYRPDALSETPDTWARLVETSRGLAGDRAPWCLALNDNPAAGWPGTDWIENILLHRSVEHYRRGPHRRSPGPGGPGARSRPVPSSSREGRRGRCWPTSATPGRRCPRSLPDA